MLSIFSSRLGYFFVAYVETNQTAVLVGSLRLDYADCYTAL